jgi:hypothetical protein
MVYKEIANNLKVNYQSRIQAMANATAEIMWIQTLLNELHISPKSARLLCDNMDARYLSSNHVFHDRTKHIKVDCHFIRDQVMRTFRSSVHFDT